MAEKIIVIFLKVEKANKIIIIIIITIIIIIIIGR